MDLERSFTYIWKDPDWLKKIIIGGALALTGIGWIPLYGWLMEMSRRVAYQEEEILPAWDQIGDYFLTGAKFTGVTLIWSAPVVLLTIFISLVPVGILIAMPEENQGAAIAMISIMTTCFWGFFMIYTIGLNLLITALWVPAAENLPFNELLHPKLAWGIFRSNTGEFIVALLVGFLAVSLFAAAGVLLCIIGVFLTTIASQLIIAHMIGQATMQARESMQPPAP